MSNRYVQLTLDDRKVIEKMYKKSSIYEIADVLGRNYSTIHRELRRLPDGQYNAVDAQEDFLKKKEVQKLRYKEITAAKSKKKNEEIANYLRDHPDADVTELSENLGKTRRYIIEHLPQARTLI